jgi:hypothetical protein
MSISKVGSFTSRTRGNVEVFRGHDAATIATIYEHATDPGITKTLGGKDLNRFSPEEFPDWVTKGGGRFIYTAWNKDMLAGLFWIGGEAFPAGHFPDSPIRPVYTAAWRTGYSTPEGDTFQGEGIGKRLALAGIADVVALTRNGGPQVGENGNATNLPPLQASGLWIDTGLGNIEGQNLYHHLGNTNRDQAPSGFTDIGIFTPQEGTTTLELEPRVGMVADPQTIQRLVAVAAELIDFA